MQTLRILLVGFLLLAGCLPALPDNLSDDDHDNSPEAAARFPQPVSVGWMIGRTVLEPVESQPVLGHVIGVVKAADGETQVIVNYGGIFDFGARQIAVRIDAMALLGQYVEIVGYKPAQLRSFPTFQPSGSTPLPADTVIKVGLARPSH